MRKRMPTLSAFSDAVDPNLTKNNHDGEVMAELKMYSRSAKNTRDIMVHLATKPHEAIMDTYTLGVDLTEAVIHHVFNTNHDEGSKYRNEQRLNGLKELWNSDGLTKREAILTFATSTLLLGGIGGSVSKVSNSTRNVMTNLYDISKKNIIDKPYASKQPHLDVSKWTINPRVKDQLSNEGFVKNLGHISEEQLVNLANNPKASFYLDTKSNHVNIVQILNDKLMRITVLKDDFEVISFGILKERNLQKYTVFGGRYVNLNPNSTPKPK